jgi:hypothetical protein
MPFVASKYHGHRVNCLRCKAALTHARFASGSPFVKLRVTPAKRLNLERETGIEPATNSLEGCDSTTELLPPFNLRAFRGPSLPLRISAAGSRSAHACFNASTWKAVTLPLSYSRQSLNL